MRKIKILLFSIIILNFIILCFSEEKFDRFEFNFKYSIEDIFFVDLNEDNLKDIIVQCKSSQNKYLYIFFQNTSGFNPQPSQILNFDTKAIVFDIGNIIDKYKGKEIVYLTNNSLNYYYLKDAIYSTESEKLMDISSIFLSPSPESPVRCKLIHDINEDGLEDYLIPIPNGLILILNKKSLKAMKINLSPAFSTRSQFRLSTQDFEIYESFSHKIIARFPEIYFSDFNGDGKKDIVSVYKDKIKVFFQKNKNEFSLNPDFEICLEILTEKEKRLPSPPMFKTFAVDLNNDDLIDFIVSKSQIKTMTSLNKTYIYLNKKGKIEIIPDQILVNKSSFGFPKIIDLNGDNKKDLVISEFKLGLFQIIKMLLTKKLNYEEAIYLYKNNIYPKLPDSKIKSEIKIDFENPEKSEEEIVYFDGDFNKDGIKDLLRKIDKKNKMAIYFGRKAGKKFFNEKPNFEIQEKELPPEIIIENLNNDRISDIILDYRKERKKKIVIFISK